MRKIKKSYKIWCSFKKLCVSCAQNGCKHNTHYICIQANIFKTYHFYLTIYFFIPNTIIIMKKQTIPDHSPLSVQEMKSIGSDRYELKVEGNHCFASFKCYDNSTVECSGVKGTCDSIVSNKFIIGVMCNGVSRICNPALPENPSGSGSAECKDLKRVACQSIKHRDKCGWTCNGVHYSGTCLYNPLSFTPTLACSDSGFGTKIDEE